MSARLFDSSRGLYDHSWFANMEPDPRFYWGRGAGWALMAMAELLSVMPEDHPDRAAVLGDVPARGAGRGRRAGRHGAVAPAARQDRQLPRDVGDAPCSPSPSRAASTAAGCRRPTRPWRRAGWRALEQRVRADGQIEGICVGTTAAYDAVYYYNRPTDLAAMQGYGPALMAGAEVMTMISSFDIRRDQQHVLLRAEAEIGPARPVGA